MLILVQKRILDLAPALIEQSLLDCETFIPVRDRAVVDTKIGRSHFIATNIVLSLDSGVASINRHELAITVSVLGTDLVPPLEFADSLVITVVCQSRLSVFTEECKFGDVPVCVVR